MSLTAIVGGTVIDGTGATPINDAVILLAGERVRSVTPRDGTAVPESAKVINAAGQFVIPGLMDANVHLSSALPDTVLEYEGRYEELVAEAAQIALRSGVTTVFDTWGHLESLAAVRDRIRSGDLIGSRIFIAGNIIGFDGPLSPDFYSPNSFLGPRTVKRINAQWEQGVGQELIWLPADEVQKRVRDYIERAGIDFVKYAACAHTTPLLTFSEHLQRAIVEAAHNAGLTVQAHTLSVESLRMEIAAGADILQHGNLTRTPIPDELLTAILKEELPVAALIQTRRYLEWVHDRGPEPMRLAFGPAQDENDCRLIDAGAKLLLTTDGAVLGTAKRNHPAIAPYVKDAPDPPYELGESHFRWLVAVTERGMRPMDALVAATRNVAEAYGLGAELGTIESGKRADLVILEEDPLVDVHNYRRIVSVIKDGAIVPRDAIPSRRILSADSAA
jgi:imidazolonepropionase-like amidohydrolase